MSILIFFLILIVLVLSHEFGHFIAAKFFGVRVDEFGFGFPPKIFSKKIGETEYSFNLLPFGGFVKIFGENPEEDSSERNGHRSFYAQSNLKKSIIIMAGVVFNFILAWLLLSLGFFYGTEVPANFSGFGPSLSESKLLVTDVLKDSPADKAGLKVNDNIVFMTSRTAALGNPTPYTLINFVASSDGQKVFVGYKRTLPAGEVKNLVSGLTPISGIVSDRLAIGIGMDMIGTLKLPPLKALYVGAIATYDLTINTFVGLYSFVSGLFFGTSSISEISGPVGLIQIVGQTAAFGWIYLLEFSALISINLGILNTIPFPALDGGRLLFIIIEAVKKRPIAPQTQNYLNMAGFIFLIGLMIIVTYSDVLKLFSH